MGTVGGGARRHRHARRRRPASAASTRLGVLDVGARIARRGRAGVGRRAVLTNGPRMTHALEAPEAPATCAGVPGPVVACVLDGVGIGAHDESDAVWLARTPNLDWLARHALATSLCAHGTAVGMPSDDDMGNSEVGHNALGAGRIFDQGAKLVERRDRRRADCSAARSGSSSSIACASRASRCTSSACFGRQRPQPHRPPVRDAAPLRRGRRARGARARAARRPRRARAQRARLRRRARRAARDAAPPRRSRLPDRVGRRPHARDDGPLRGRLAHRRARLEHARARRGARVPQRARGDRDALPRGPVGQRPVSPAVRDRRRERPGRPDPRRRRGGAVQLPRRPRDRALARVRGRGVRRVPARAAPRRAVRRHDAVRRRPAASRSASSSRRPRSSARSASTSSTTTCTSSRSARPRSSAT